MSKVWIAVALLLAGTLFLVPSEPPAAKAPKPVRILTPAGGELYVIGSEQRIRLDPKTRSKQVTIELSTDGGTTFAPLGTVDNTVADKSQRNVLSFTVPGPGSGRCVVRASAGGVPSLSPGFSIGAANVVEEAFVKVAGDDMTGPLNVAGTVGIGTTTPRGTFEVADPTQAKMIVSGDPGVRYEFLSTATGLTLQEAKDIGGGATQISPRLTIDPATATTRLVGGFRSISAGAAGLVFNGGMTLEATRLNNIDFAANDSTCVFFANSTSSSITVTLPTAPSIGRFYVVKKIAAANTVTIDGNGATIDGAATVALAALNAFRIVMWNGTAWSVIGQ